MSEDEAVAVGPGLAHRPFNADAGAEVRRILPAQGLAAYDDLPWIPA